MLIFALPVLCQCILIGIVNKNPISSCDENSQSGFVPELINLILQDSGQTNIETKYLCFDSYNSAAEALKSKTIDITYLPMSSSNYEFFKFSVPFLNNGLVLLTKNYTKSLYWVIYEPFETTLWMLIIILPLILGHFYWFFERTSEGPIDLSYFSGISQSVWQVCLCMFFLKRDEIRKISTKLMIFAYWFFVFILTASYISTLSSIILSFSRQVNVDYFLSMGNKRVGTYEEYDKTLQDLGMNTKAYIDTGVKPYIEMLNDVLDGVVDAAAFPYSEAWLLNSEYCKLTFIGSIFLDSYLGFAYQLNTIDKNILINFEISLQSLLDEQFIKRKLNKHLLLTYSTKCEDGLDLPLPIDLLISCLTYPAFLLLFALPIFILFRKRMYKLKITDKDLITLQTTTGSEKEHSDFINMMIKFELVLGSSKTLFNKKVEELKIVLNEDEIISSQYKDLLQKLLFKIESI